MRTPKALLALPVVLVLSGCLGGFRVAETPASGPEFRPERFFAGVTHGEGVLATRGKADGRFRVESLDRLVQRDQAVVPAHARHTQHQ